MDKLFLLVLIVCFVSCKSNPQQVKQDKETTTEISNPIAEKSSKKEVETSFTNANGEKIQKIVKTPKQWASELSKMEYYVLREKGTERPRTSELLEIKDTGVYTCRACDLPLFESDTKFKSGTGWPSFYQPIEREVILEDTDYDLGYARTEVMCRRCEGHLGHVFKDGPDPTGLRYCINGVSLRFQKSE